MAAKTKSTVATDHQAALAEVDRRTAPLLAQGMDRRKALANIFRGDPALHARWLQATNPRVAIGTGTDASTGAVAEVARHIAPLMEAGKSRKDAMAAVFKKDPDLHARYTAETQPRQTVTK